MIQKILEKEKAIQLRKQGKTYAEILELIPVAKSTLSIWLKEVGMAKAQKQKYTVLKRLAAQRGGDTKRKQRVEKQSSIFLQERSRVKKLSQYEFFLIGVCLYWAEGTKEKEYKPGSGVAFSNMDPKMIILFLKWLQEVCKIPGNMIGFEIMVHKSHKHRSKQVRQFWASTTGFPIDRFSRVYFKRNKIKKTNRKNTGQKYHGVLKIKVRRSSDLVRKIATWSESIFEKIIQ